MPRRRVLYVSHNHPSVFPGGAEGYAVELHEAMRDDDSFEPVLLAKAGPPVSNGGCPHPGTLLSPVNGDSDQYFFYTDASGFDSLLGTSPNADVYMEYFREFLRVIRPDVVHFQHTLFLGYEVLLETRRTLPEVPIVYTLHEFLPICRRDGQMLRVNGTPCLDASPRNCHKCFPEVSPQEFFLRKRFIQSHLSLVDMFIAPSQFLLERYVDWGIPRERIRYEEYGRRINGDASSTIDARQSSTRTRTRFGFFGQLNPFKGINVLLEAMARLGEGSVAAPTRKGRSPHLWVHGANLELQSGSFQAEIEGLLERTKDNVTLVGRYEHAELPALMANVDWVVVPSLWWENSPLVIQEAYRYGRPVISSDIGGMAEKVPHDVSGLNFRAGDPDDLAQTIARAARTDGLWTRLRDGIPEVYSMKEHIPTLTALYADLIEQRAGRGSQLPIRTDEEVFDHE